MSNTAYNFGRNLVMEKRAFIGALANVGLSVAAPYLLGSAGKAFARQLALRTMSNPAFAGRAARAGVGGLVDSALGGASRAAIRGATTDAKVGLGHGMDSMIQSFRAKGATPLPSAFEAFKAPNSIRGLASDKGFQKSLFGNSNKVIQTAGHVAHGLQHPATSIAGMLAPSVFPVFPQGNSNV